MKIRTCSNKDGSGCEFPATLRYTWPGRDEGFACLPHALALQTIMQAIGGYLQMIPLRPDEMMVDEPEAPK